MRVDKYFVVATLLLQLCIINYVSDLLTSICNTLMIFIHHTHTVSFAIINLFSLYTDARTKHR